MPVRGHSNRGTKTNALGVRCPPREDLERVGSDGHLERMVFGGPDGLETAPIGHLHHVERVRLDLLHIDVVIQPFKIHCQLKLHYSPSQI